MITTTELSGHQAKLEANMWLHTHRSTPGCWHQFNGAGVQWRYVYLRNALQLLYDPPPQKKRKEKRKKENNGLHSLFLDHGKN